MIFPDACLDGRQVSDADDWIVRVCTRAIRSPETIAAACTKGCAITSVHPFHPGDEGFASYRRQDVNISFSGPPVIEGFRDTNLGSKTGMWRVPMHHPCHKARHGYSLAAKALASADLANAMQTVTTSPATKTAHNVCDLPSIEQAVHWMHACMGYPATATWIKACRARNLVGFPFADEKYIRKYFPENDETAAGHMQRQRQNIRSTKPKAAPLTQIDTTDLHGRKERDVFIKVVELKNAIHTDQTGRFGITSQSGMQYIMVMVKVNSNAI